MKRPRLGPRSLRGRLVLSATTIALLVACAAGVTGGAWVWAAETQAVSAALQTRLQLAEETVAPDGTVPAVTTGPKAALIQVVGIDRTVLKSSSALGGFGPLVDPAAVGAARGEVYGSLSLPSPDVDLATLAVPWHVERQGARVPAVLVVALDTEGFSTGRDSLLGLLLAGLVTAVVTIAVLVWWVGGRALRDVTALTRRAEETRPSGPHLGLPVPRADAELQALVLALNRMLSRLHAAHTNELVFAAEAGHRLRTPLATLRAEAELALVDGDEGQRACALRQVVADADELAVVVDQLLARTRARVVGPLPLGSVLEAATAQWQRQARAAGVAVQVEAVVVDPHTSCAGFREVVDPLVDNAVRHCSARGQVLVGVEQIDRGGTLDVLVSNEGPGVPPELAGRLFEPWVSGRGAGHVGGLGLHTSRRTALDHGGDVMLLPSDQGRTLFRAVLPLSGNEQSTSPGTGTDRPGWVRRKGLRPV